jgi:hypothetical protein
MANSRVEVITGSLAGSIISNAASEATLQELLAAMHRLDRTVRNSGRGGGNPPPPPPPPPGPTVDVNSVNAFNAATAGLSKTLYALGTTVGTTVSLFAKHNASLSDWSKGITDVTSQLPVVGKALGALGGALTTGLKQFEDWDKALIALSSTGAAFNNDMLQMRMAAAQAYMSLPEFSKLLSENSQHLVGLGGTVTQGAIAFSKVSKSLMQQGGLGENLIHMGFTIDDVNHGLANFIGTTLRGTRVTESNTKNIAGLYATYATNLDRLSKLTGKSRETLEAEQAALKTRAAWQLHLATLDETTRANLNLAIDNIVATRGETAAIATMEMELFGNVVSQNAQAYVTLDGVLENTKKIVQGAHSTRDNEEFAEYVAREVEHGNNRAFAQLKDIKHVIAFGDTGNGGFASTLLEVATPLINTMTKTGRAGERSVEEQNKEIDARIEAAETEQAARAAFTQGLRQTTLALTRTQSEVLIGFLNTMSGVQTKLNALMPEFLTSVGNLERYMADAAGRIPEIMSVFAQEILTKLTDFSGMFDFVSSDLKEKFTALGTFIGEYIEPIFIGLGIGITAKVLSPLLLLGTGILSTSKIFTLLGGALRFFSGPIGLLILGVTGIVKILKDWGWDLEVAKGALSYVMGLVKGVFLDLQIGVAKFLDLLSWTGVVSGQADKIASLEREKAANEGTLTELAGKIEARRAANTASSQSDGNGGGGRDGGGQDDENARALERHVAELNNMADSEKEEAKLRAQRKALEDEAAEQARELEEEYHLARMENIRTELNLLKGALPGGAVATPAASSNSGFGSGGDGSGYSGSTASAYATPAGPAATVAPIPGGLNGLLEQIAKGEGTSDAQAQRKGFASGYDVSLGYGAYGGGTSKPISQMTLGEIHEYQRRMLQDPKNKWNSSAVGKYQIVGKTLRELQRQLGLPDSTIFSKDVQDRMATKLLESRGLNQYMSGNMSLHQFQLGLAREWASIADPRTGRGYYGNQQTAHTSDSTIKGLLTGLKEGGPVETTATAATPTDTTATAATPTDTTAAAQLASERAAALAAQNLTDTSIATLVTPSPSTAPNPADIAQQEDPQQTSAPASPVTMVTKETTLNDLLKSLEDLNNRVSVLISVTQEGSDKVVRTTRQTASGNMRELA